MNLTSHRIIFQVEMTLADVSDLAGKRAIAEALIESRKASAYLLFSTVYGADDAANGYL